MSNPETEKILPPFQTFNFLVEINVPGVSTEVCSAAFAECDGLEMTAEIKTIREGGANGRQVHLSGPVSYGQLTLRRGMTGSFDLWRWFERAQTVNDPGLRGDAEIVILAGDGATEQARFVLKDCLPTRLRAPALNAMDGQVAIEEIQIAYEYMTLKT